jgi:ABC-type Na+ efflux pump permease subunit
MTKFFRVAWHEYSRHVFRKRFIFALLSMPLFLGLMVALVFLVIWMEANPTPIGYIDHSGLLVNAMRQQEVKWPMRTVPMLAYTDETSAKADLQAGKLQAYYIISQDYLQSGQVEQVYLKEPKGEAINQFDSFLSTNLLANQPKEITNRILEETSSSYNLQTRARIPKTAPQIFSCLSSLVSCHHRHEHQLRLPAASRRKRKKSHHGDHGDIRLPGQLMSGKIIADIAG